MDALGKATLDAHCWVSSLRSDSGRLQPHDGELLERESESIKRNENSPAKPGQADHDIDSQDLAIGIPDARVAQLAAARRLNQLKYEVNGDVGCIIGRVLEDIAGRDLRCQVAIVIEIQVALRKSVRTSILLAMSLASGRRPQAQH